VPGHPNLPLADTQHTPSSHTPPLTPNTVFSRFRRPNVFMSVQRVKSCVTKMACDENSDWRQAVSGLTLGWGVLLKRVASVNQWTTLCCRAA